jgi:hypothetical protein
MSRAPTRVRVVPSSGTESHHNRSGVACIAARAGEEELHHHHHAVVVLIISEGQAAGARGLPTHGAHLASAAERHKVPGRGHRGDPGADAGGRGDRQRRRCHLFASCRRPARRRRLLADQWRCYHYRRPWTLRAAAGPAACCIIARILMAPKLLNIQCRMVVFFFFFRSSALVFIY